AKRISLTPIWGIKVMIDIESDALPKEVREGLERAREQDRRKTGGKLRVQVGDTWYPIRSFDQSGFEVGIDDAPKLRGLVEIHDGARMLRQALIIAGASTDDVMRYEFKRATASRSAAPVDYVRKSEAPVGYLPRA
ncbi:MAG: hypothetical protein AAGF30_16265, partial [Pseudomonadota bacterium]